MPEKDNTGLDTTVILRLLTGEPVKQFEKARRFIEEQLANGKKLFVIVYLLNTLLLLTNHCASYPGRLLYKNILNSPSRLY